MAVDGAIKAICNRLVVVEMSSRTSRDLAEQCIKVRASRCNIKSRTDIYNISVQDMFLYIYLLFEFV